MQRKQANLYKFPAIELKISLQVWLQPKLVSIAFGENRQNSSKFTTFFSWFSIQLL